MSTCKSKNSPLEGSACMKCQGNKACGENFMPHLNKVDIVLEIRARSGKVKKGQNSQGKVKEFKKNVEVLPFLTFNLMISVSSKILYQEVGLISLRSGKSQGNLREDESRKKMATLLNKTNVFSPEVEQWNLNSVLYRCPPPRFGLQ